MLESEYSINTGLKMLPKYLYEALPTIYFILGLMCALTIQSSIALVSSSFLIVAAVLVYKMRKTYRSQNINRKSF